VTFDQRNLQQILDDSFADFHLSVAEKQRLQSALALYRHSPDALNYLRNHAFALVREGHQGEHFLAQLRWLEGVIKQIDQLQNQSLAASNQAYFSPGDAPRQAIIGLLDGAQQSIDACVFTISDDNISDALFAAHQRGVSVRVISDNDKALDEGSDVRWLARQGVKVKVDNSPNHMHHKFCLVDQTQLISGSFNWTRSATRYNQENIIVSEDDSLLTAFARKFEQLWRSCRWLASD